MGIFGKKEESWLDRVMRGAHPRADLSDHYFWDDVLDAETDGYLED